MTSTRKSSIISTLFAMAISIFFIGYALSESGKEAIQLQMQDALKETIAIDFHRRENAEAKHIGKPLNRKVKGIKMIEKNGPITIVFKDSVEKFMAEQ